MKRIAIVIFFLPLLLVTIKDVEGGVDRYVAPNGRDFTVTGIPNDCTNLGYSPCRTIQHAIGQSAAGDHIKVRHGIYRENIKITSSTVGDTSQGIVLEISGGWGGNFTQRYEDPSLTTIDAFENDSVFYLRPAYNTEYDVTIQNFKLTGGKGLDNNRTGGAIVLYASRGNTSLRILNNIITDNETFIRGGGAVFANLSTNEGGILDIDLTGNNITNNNADYGYQGGAVFVQCSGGELNLKLEENTIYENYNPWPDPNGAVYVETLGYNRPTPSITFAEFIKNTVHRNWGGIYFYVWTGEVEIKLMNNMLTNNYNHALYLDSPGPGTISASIINNTITGGLDYQEGPDGGIITNAGSTVQDGSIGMDLINTIVWGNEGSDLYLEDPDVTANVSYSIIENIYTNYGVYNDLGYNSSDNPRFVASGFDADYHLSENSPAIDTGICGELNNGRNFRIAPYEDFEGDPRPNPGDLECSPIFCIRGRYLNCDIGADEYYLPMAMPCLPLLLLSE